MKRHTWSLRRTVVGVLAVAALVFAGSHADLRASGILNTTIGIRLNATGEKAIGTLSTAKDPLISDYTLLLANGTGANQASNMFHDQRTLTASSSENLDLAGSLTNGFGVTLTFTKLKAIIIHAATANVNNVQVGGAASNALVGWVADSTDIVSVKPGGTFIFIAPDNTGVAVTAGTGDILKVANSSSGTSVVYDVVFIGVD